MNLQKDTIAATLSSQMASLEALEEEARNEADGVKKAVLLAKCRMAQVDLKKQAQNVEDLGSKVNMATIQHLPTTFDDS